MNPAANGAVSGSLASYFITIINWLLPMIPWLHAAPMPTSVSEAFTGLFTAAFSYYLHLRTQNGDLGLFLGKSKSPVAPPITDDPNRPPVEPIVQPPKV